jgi:hypothetical protein
MGRSRRAAVALCLAERAERPWASSDRPARSHRRHRAWYPCAGPTREGLTLMSDLLNATSPIALRTPPPLRHHLDRRAATIAEAGSGDDDDLLNTMQVASWLGVSTQWIEIGRSKGYGPEFVRCGIRRIRYLRRSVKKWLLARQYASTAGYGQTVEDVAPPAVATVEAAVEAVRAVLAAASEPQKAAAVRETLRAALEAA